jgi:hypothetical protein
VYARLDPGATLPDCPEAVGDPGPSLVDGFIDPGPAVCECSCGVVQTQECGLDLYFDEPLEVCDEMLLKNFVVGFSGACTNVEIDGSAFFGTGPGFDGICEKNESESLPPSSWTSSIRTCRLPAEAMACNDGACLPAIPEGFESQWCIYKDGDAECPAGAFDEKTVFYTGVEDTRGCSDCSCGPGGVNCSEVMLEVFDQPDCTGDPITTIASGECVALTGSSFAVDLGNEAPCAVNEMAMSEGDITPSGPITFCCDG